MAHGHQAALSIDLFCRGESPAARPPAQIALASQKLGIHEWSYDNEISLDQRRKVPLQEKRIALLNLNLEVERGFDPDLAYKEAERCLNCDMQTVFTASQCIECDACVDICPVDCITFLPQMSEASEAQLREQLKVPAHQLDQPLYLSTALNTGQVMIKDENVCLHCGLCAERCPTAAWDMQKFVIDLPKAGASCRSH
ncbi:MAG TPA: 4Fe-4S dicluster domain-containing protein [Pseudomonadales bacterium]|nr:4Fe-4S dicluster domain-containing protein [Pseudomonadales bacterium]HNL31606.1 4Fe-4S dicluster domain-containing protein [Pseudomonadales bacterium]HNN64630.1 4Fe-4S dicluster domain-containing protein [Pseudomonadales bacterium]